MHTTLASLRWPTLVRATAVFAVVASPATSLAQRVAGGDALSVESRKDRPTVELRAGEVTYHAGDRDGRLELSCAPSAVVALEGNAFVACGGAVLVFDLAQNPPRQMRRLEVDGAATGLFVVGGRAWVEVVRREARLIEELHAVAGEETRAARPAPRAPPARATGRVIQAQPTRAIIDLGRAHGLARGDRIELYREESVALAPGERAVREHRVAVVEVTTVSQASAEVRIGQNERIAIGTLARRTNASLTESRLAPPRLGGLLTAEVMVRPFLALGTLGIGSVNQAAVSYQFEMPFTIEANLDPIGVGAAEDVRVLTGLATVTPTYDTDYFQIGLGVGASRVIRTTSRALPALESAPRAAFALSQVARLGARDGLSLRVHNSFVLYEDEFVYGSTSAAVQTPLGSSSRLWLLARGGAGVSGYGFGELALRLRARGNGDRGSLFMTPAIGFAVLSGEQIEECDDGSGRSCVTEATYAGPMVGFGMEWRM